MSSRNSFPPRRAVATWLGLLAIVLHVCAPFMGLGFSGGAPALAGHAHDQTAHSHAGTADTSADDAPLNPDQICIGDCPFCSLNDRPIAPLTRWLLALVRADATIAAPRVTFSAPWVFQPGLQTRPRAPPVPA